MENEVGKEWMVQSYELLLRLIAELERATKASEAMSIFQC